MSERAVDFIAIGASAGGISVLQKLLSDLNGKIDIPIGIVIHLPADSTVNPVLVFQKWTRQTVLEVCDKMPIDRGTVYFGPPGYHLVIENEESFALNVDELVCFSRPSIDVFFESVANVFQDRCCGILMTGASADGAMGLKALDSVGGITVVQDPAEAENSVMPESALKLIHPHYVGKVLEISHFLQRLAKGELVDGK